MAALNPKSQTLNPCAVLELGFLRDVFGLYGDCRVPFQWECGPQAEIFCRNANVRFGVSGILRNTSGF